MCSLVIRRRISDVAVARSAQSLTPESERGSAHSTGVTVPRAALSLRLLVLVALISAGVAVACGGSSEPVPEATSTRAAPTARVFAPPTATSTAAVQSAVEYVVEPGDTLLGIAEQFGVTVEAITAANDISDPDLIAVGQTLVIPSP